jgi:hypothetical protein
VARLRTPPNISLTAHKNYLRAIRYALALEYGTGSQQLEAIAKDIEELPGFSKICIRTPERPDVVRSLINTAWQTEVAINVPRFSASDSGLRAISIHWATIQLYFAVHGAACAWLQARNDASPRDHRAALNTLSTFATGRTQLIPEPWNYACSSWSTASFCGGLLAHSRQYANPVRSPQFTSQSVRDYICCALRSVREDDLTRRLNQWRRDTKYGTDKRLPRGVRKQVDDHGRFLPTTLFDYFHNLRLRANYGDAEFLMLGEQHVEEAEYYYENLWRICSATLLLFEKLLAAFWGRANIVEAAQDIVKRSSTAQRTVGNRIDLW